MNKVKMNIWGRDFHLPMMIKQFKGTQITDCQIEAADKFAECEEIVNEAQPEVEKYILEDEKNEIKEIDNIFKYIIPKSIFIPEARTRIAAIMCNYKFDMEHGIAVVFENENFKEIGPQDLVL